MFTKSEIVFDSTVGGGRRIKGYIYEAREPKVMVQLCHGMAEFVERYEEMISRLCAEGISVCGIDMLGHGGTSKLNEDPLGYFGDVKNSYKNIFEDNKRFYELVSARTQMAPSILFGHSMGSFVVRAMYSRAEYASLYKAFIFSSTKGPEPLAGVGLTLAKFFTAIGLGKKKGHLINVLAFGTYNSRIRHPKTAFDWLSTDEHEVSKYVEHPLCGFFFTNKGFVDLLSIISEIQSEEAYENYCKKPCLFTYGDQDPVTGYGKGVEKVIAKMKERDIEVTSVKFESYRHELMNDYCREKYYRTVIDYINSQI